MDILIGLYNHLSNDEKIKKIVGNKIYPVVLPQNIALPAIVYSSVLANYDSALQGDTGFVRQTIQIVSHAKTYKEARELSRLIKKESKTYMVTWVEFLLKQYLLKQIMN